jgi:anti-sigma factor RsiW
VNCSEALDLLLEADPSELDGQGDSALARHLRTCPECGAAAGQILEGQRRLGESLSVARSKTPVEQALRLARVKARSRWRRRRIWQAAIPLAAAAGMASVIVTHGGRNSALEQVWEGNSPQVERGLDLVTSPGKDVAVFEMEDRPDIVVVWFFETGD